MKYFKVFFKQIFHRKELTFDEMWDAITINIIISTILFSAAAILIGFKSEIRILLGIS